MSPAGRRPSARRRLRSRAASFVRRVAGTEGLAHRVAPVYVGDDTALLITQWGGTLFVDTRDTTLAPSLLLHGIWEPDTTAWFHETLRPGQVFVDVGANIGYYSVLARRLVGEGGRVIAVEPHPRLCDLCRRNMIVNGYRNVVHSEVAAWWAHEELDFYIRSRYGANSSVGSVGSEQLVAHADTEELIRVRGAPLDDLLEDHGRVDVIKVDVEGAELRAFTGMAKTLERNRDVTVMFEWSPGQIHMVGDDPRELIKLLTNYGFRFQLLEETLVPIDPERLAEVPYANVVAAR